MGMFSAHLTPWCKLCSAFSAMWELLRDCLQFLRTISHTRAALAAEILFPRKQLAYYQDHRTTSTPRRVPVVPVVLVSPVRLAGSACSRQDEYFPSLASQRFQVVLALEVARWPPTAPETDSAAHRSYGQRKRDLVPGLHDPAPRTTAPWNPAVVGGSL